MCVCMYIYIYIDIIHTRTHAESIRVRYTLGRTDVQQVSRTTYRFGLLYRLYRMLTSALEAKVK